jgi:hypothetical protein
MLYSPSQQEIATEDVRTRTTYGGKMRESRLSNAELETSGS